MKQIYLFLCFFIASISTSYAQNYFVTTWNTQAGTGQTGNTTIMLPLSGCAYDVYLNYDGGNFDADRTNLTGTRTITFTDAGTHTIVVRPTANICNQLQIKFSGSNERHKLTSNRQMGRYCLDFHARSFFRML